MDVCVYISPWKIDANGEGEVRDEGNRIKFVPYREMAIISVGDKTFYVDLKELQAAADICIRSLI